MTGKTHTIAVDDRNFDSEVVQADVPVLVDFWAEWCGPCRAIGPAIDALAEEFDGLAKVAKLNVDDSPAVAGRYGIRSIPTLLLVKDGEVQESLIGARPQSELRAVVERHLANH